MKTPAFICAGQSNMVGSYNIPPYEIDEATLYIDGINRKFGEEKFGPECSIARTLTAKMGKIILIKEAKNGTSLLAWSPEWTEEKAKLTNNTLDYSLYKRLINNTRNIIGSEDCEICAIFWMQGERDCKHQIAAENYYNNFRQLLESFKRDIGDVPIIFGRVDPPLKKFNFISEVRTAQQRIAKEIENTFMIDTDHIGRKRGRLHHNKIGINDLGVLLANQYLLLGGFETIPILP
jgi:hypothetical protein